MTADRSGQGWRGRLGMVFGADLRSLALFRIAMASVLLGDLIDRSRNLAAHYTDLGIYPASLALKTTGQPIYLSLHYHVSGSVPAEWALFALQGVFAIALLVGFHTRIATIASWYLLASLQLRNPYLATLGGDRFLRLMIFWAMFLPLGARFSLDARRGRGERSSDWLVSVPTAALLVQIALMYVATGLHKSGSNWADGTALTYALNLEQFQTAFTPLLREATWLHAPLTHFTRYFEIFGPLIAFVPVWNAGFRLLAFVVFVGFHLSLATFLDIGPFPFMCIASWFAFLPSVLWDELPARLTGRAHAEPDTTAPAPKTPWPLQVAAGVSLLWVLLYVGAGVSGRSLPGPVQMPGLALRINQTWNMFSPNPSHDDTWLVVDGRLADGLRVNPFSGGGGILR